MKIYVISLALVITGCQQPSAQNNDVSRSVTNTATSPQTPAVIFEIRDFTLDEDDNEFGILYKGHGTLITRDPHLMNGNYLVWISAKQTHGNDELWRTEVFLKDGLGTIKTADYMTKSDKEKKVKYYDWEILGYVPLEKANIKSAPESEPAKES